MLKLVRYLKPYTASCLLILLFVSIQVVGTLRLPKEMSDIVNVGIIQRGIPGTMQTDSSVAQQVAEEIRTAGASITTAQRAYFTEKGGIMLVITLIAGVAAVLAGFFASRVSAAVARDLRGDIFKQVESFSLSEFDTFSTASLIIRSTNDIQQVQQMTFFLLRMATMAPLTMLGAFYMSLHTDTSLAWILGVTLPLLLLVIGILIYFGMPIFRSIQTKTDHLNMIAREGLTGVRVIRAFDREPTQQKRFEEANDDLTDTTIKVNKMMVTSMPIMQLLMQLTTVAIIWFGSHYINDMTIQLGDMMAFLQYAMQILFSVLMLSMIFVMYPRVSVSAERINDVLETDSSIADPDEPKTTQPRSIAAQGTAPDEPSSVEFRTVTYRFPGSEGAAVCDISFVAPANTVTAIIGSTGSGKSTILNLIVRLYDVSTGAVLVDGIDVRDMTQHHLHELVGYIPQKAVLFDGTIAENIRFGKEDATDDEIWHALDVAQAADFVRALPDGLDSRVAQGGTNFSGGQKQRLSIARAIIKHPRVYLFDDALSALDLKTDAALREAIEPEFKKAVAIIVAQRISSIIDADQILVMDEGCIVGRGTHEELLKTNQVYREIAESQMTAEELIEGGYIKEALAEENALAPQGDKHDEDTQEAGHVLLGERIDESLIERALEGNVDALPEELIRKEVPVDE